MSIRYSTYNHLVKLSDDSWLIYNFRTGYLSELDFISKVIFDHALEFDRNDKHIKSFLERGFLVESDEIAMMRDDYIHCLLKLDEFHLTICPTMACNFNCPYCFEESKSGKMDEETQNNIVSFVEHHINEYKINKFSVTWFGGEPLLAIDVIESLSKKLIELSNKHNLEYTAGIITNGYFFNQETVDLLEKYLVKSAQITLDGPSEESHDATRHLKNGQGTYNTIINNLLNIKTNIKISIRCNVQKNNIDKYQKLVDLIEDIKSKTNNDLNVYAARMSGECSGKDKDGYDKFEVSLETFSKVKTNNNKLPQSRHRVIYCMAQNPLAFGIDNKGNMYKCWENMGDINTSFYNIKDFLNENIDSFDRNNYLNYQETLWNYDEECKNCKLFPYCLSGCPFQRIYKGKKECNAFKYSLDEYVLGLYNQRKK